MLVRTNDNWLPQVFNEFFNNDCLMPRMTGTPAINVIENKDNYEVQLAAPGMTRDDFKVTLDPDNNLVIELEKKTQTTDDNNEAKETGRYLRREFSYTKFRQAFSLPDDVNLDQIGATAQDGVLTITLPRVAHEEPTPQVKEITIN